MAEALKLSVDSGTFLPIQFVIINQTLDFATLAAFFEKLPYCLCEEFVYFPRYMP
jgi:hypothetical protein